MLNILAGFLSVVYVLACLFLIFVVLIQKGEGGGLGGAFGGGAVDAAFGSQADMTWKRATSAAAGLFIVLSIVLGQLERPPESSIANRLGNDNKAGMNKDGDKKAGDKKDAGKKDADKKGDKKAGDKKDEKKPADKAGDKKDADKKDGKPADKKAG